MAVCRRVSSAIETRRRKAQGQHFARRLSTRSQRRDSHVKTEEVASKPLPFFKQNIRYVSDRFWPLLGENLCPTHSERNSHSIFCRHIIITNDQSLADNFCPLKYMYCRCSEIQIMKRNYIHLNEMLFLVDFSSLGSLYGHMRTFTF